MWCFGFSNAAAVWKTCLLGAVSGNNTASSSRNIWVSGLSSNTKAADLKNLFGKYGKVDNVFFVCVVNYLSLLILSIENILGIF